MSGRDVRLRTRSDGQVSHVVPRSRCHAPGLSEQLMIQVRSPPAREVFAAGYRYPLDMSARWRWGFVIVFVVAALGAFMPNLLASGTAVTSHTASLSLSEHPVAPTACVLS